MDKLQKIKFDVMLKYKGIPLRAFKLNKTVINKRKDNGKNK